MSANPGALRIRHAFVTHTLDVSPFTRAERAVLSTWAVVAHTGRDSHLFSVPVFLYSCVAAVGVTLL